MFCSSATFDPEVVDEPDRFDIPCGPNPHVGFGDSRSDYCIGANLARLEMDPIFNAQADCSQWTAEIWV
jgi:cholest-4-en-3-one 26-monooxygenase